MSPGAQPASAHSAATAASVRALQQFANRSKIKIQLLWCNVELFGEIENRLLQLHEREADVLRFVFGERPGFHAPDRLTLEELPDQLDERQHELQHGPSHFLWIRVPSRRTRGRGG